jgi:hypothetical protein
VKTSFRRKETCGECPWRKDVPTGRFPASRFAKLRSTCEQGFHPIFACHKTAEGSETACVGYLMVEGINNFVVRLALIRHEFDPKELVSEGALFASFEEMARANGSRARRRR